MKSSRKELHARTVASALRGGIKGAAAGAAASLATGAAVIVTAPAWVPFLGGTAVIAGTTVTLWSAFGGSMGAIVSGARAYWNIRREQEDFEKAFPPVSTRKSTKLPKIASKPNIHQQPIKPKKVYAL